MTKEEAIEIVKEAHDLLSNVQEKDWTTERFARNGKCCAEGHYTRLTHGLKPDETLKIGEISEAGTLTTAVSVLSVRCFACALYHVNDYGTLKYKQATPKKRVLALLEDLAPELKEKEVTHDC